MSLKKITKYKLRKLILQEIKLLKEGTVSSGDAYTHPVKNWENISEEGFGIMPFILNGKLIETDDDGGSFFNQIREIMGDPGILKDFEAGLGDAFLDLMCRDDDLNSVFGLFDQIAPGFEMYPEADISFGGSGDTVNYGKLKGKYFLNEGFKFTQLGADYDGYPYEKDSYDVDLGYGFSSRMLDSYLGNWSSYVEDYISTEKEGLVNGFDEGSSGYGNQDIAGSASFNLNILENMINSRHACVLLVQSEYDDELYYEILTR
tara:strand:+ start:141 stop:923 length:783 start_codon:yes stop_codon:yes gene_type:complete